MATPLIKTLSSEAGDPTEPAVTPRVRNLSSESGIMTAPAPYSPVIRTLADEAGEAGPQPSHSPRVRTLASEAVFFEKDFLAPADPAYGTIEAAQVNGDPKGRTQVTLNFPTVTTSQVTSGEHLGQATGTTQVLNTKYDSITEP